MLEPFFDGSGDASHDPPEVPDMIDQEMLPRCEKLDGSSLRIVPGNIEAGQFCEANCVTITDGERAVVYVPLRSERKSFPTYPQTPQGQIEELSKLSFAPPLKILAMEGGGLEGSPVVLTIEHALVISRYQVQVILDLLTRMAEEHPLTPANCDFPLTLDRPA